MKITWLGHSCFKIEKEGFTIVIDPYEDYSVPGLLPVREKANMVICSHEHGDHNARSLVELVESEKNPFTIAKIMTYHDDEKGKKRGENIIHILDDGENKVAHFGDLGCELEPEQQELLTNIDAIMIPVGGFFTIDANQATCLVKNLKPRMVLPMHYRSDEDGYGFDVIGTLEEFIKKIDSATFIPVSEIETTYELPDQVVVMKPANCMK